MRNDRSDGGGLLREAPVEIRAYSRELPGSGAGGLYIVPESGTPLDQGEALYRAHAARRARWIRGPVALFGAPRVTRSKRVLSVSVRGGGDPDDGRRRRVDYRVHRRRP